MSSISEYISQEEQEMFEKFLLDQMDTNEKEQFKKKLDNDLKLSENFEQFKIMFRAVEEDGLRAKFETFHSEIKEEATTLKPARLFQKYNLIIAASVALLIVVGSAYLYLNITNSNKTLYKKYYSVDPGLPTVMGNNNNYDFYKAMVDYKQGKYDTAIKTWESLLTTKPQNDTLNYFLGAAYFASKNENRAVSFFETVSENKQSYFYDDSQFYLGLIALKEGQQQKAKVHFELSQTDKSNEILEELKTK